MHAFNLFEAGLQADSTRSSIPGFLALICPFPAVFKKLPVTAEKDYPLEVLMRHLMHYLTSSYDYRLVALSVIVATLASYTALNLAGRVTVTEGRTSRLWLIGGAFSMGVGIWSMHFIGMLAFSLPIPIGYDVSITLASMVIAMIVSGFALHIVSRGEIGPRRLVSAGIIMGLGICAMHYTGMYAMRMDPPIHYDPTLFGASVVIAIVAAMAALLIAFKLRREDSLTAQFKKVVAAIVMGLAITGMHYTGMAAANFHAHTMTLATVQLDNSWLAVTITVTSFSILTITLLLSVIDSRLASQTSNLIRSLRHANEKLHHQALHDNLTRLPNRTLLEDRINQSAAACKRSGRRFAVMFLDLDRFKTINDSLGHHYGDKLLQGAAERLSNVLRIEDTVARIGGDEFVILLSDIGEPQGAALVAEKVLEAMGTPFEIEGQQQNISGSIGISIFPEDGEDVRALMVAADSAMYHAKKMGRANYQFFTLEMNTAAQARLEMEMNLRRAIEHNELELHYQPKVDIKKGEIVGVEALVRWRHPTRGLISPSEFIPVAEEIGLIIPLGGWVLMQACQQNRKWQDMGLPPLRMAVNLSSVQFRQKYLVEFIERTLEETGLDPAYLELEITESVIMQNPEEAAVTLERLHKRGIHLSIDDFGTGYSSLSCLRRFPLDTLKIDRSFVRDIGVADDGAIVSSVVALAHTLKLGVIAEGVETEDQLDFLRTLGCDQYQGYYLSRPVPPKEFERLLTHPPKSDAQAHTRIASLGKS